MKLFKGKRNIDTKMKWNTKWRSINTYLNSPRCSEIKMRMNYYYGNNIYTNLYKSKNNTPLIKRTLSAKSITRINICNNKNTTKLQKDYMRPLSTIHKSKSTIKFNIPSKYNNYKPKRRNIHFHSSCNKQNNLLPKSQNPNIHTSIINKLHKCFNITPLKTKIITHKQLIMINQSTSPMRDINYIY